MNYVPRFTVLASRLSDGALIVIPVRRYRRGPANCTAFTAKANEISRRAGKAKRRGA